MNWIKTHDDRIVNLDFVEDIWLNEEKCRIEFALRNEIILYDCESLEEAKGIFNWVCRDLLEIKD